MLRCSKLGEFSLAPGKLAWPWVAFSPGPERAAFAVPVAGRSLAIRRAASLDREDRVELPTALPVPTVEASRSGTTSRQPGLHSLALHPDGRTLVAFGWHAERDVPVACVTSPAGATELVDLGPVLGDMGPLAATFTRDGASLWVSAESATGAAIVRLRFHDFGLEAKAAFPPPPPPAAHELFLHPGEDAVLLTMACGEDGTFIRVARMLGGKLALSPAEGDAGLEPCGLAEATEDGDRVCLVMPERIELRRWPDLARVAEVELSEELSANYNGVRVGGRFVVSATADLEEGEDERALVLNDALKLEDDAPAPPGMWAGRLGKDQLVTLGRERSDERPGFLYRLEP